MNKHSLFIVALQNLANALYQWEHMGVSERYGRAITKKAHEELMDTQPDEEEFDEWYGVYVLLHSQAMEMLK